MKRVEGVFRSATERRQLPAGTVIFSEGDSGSEMFGVIEGRVERTHDGQPVGEVGPDDVFGELALIASSPRTRTAVATEDTVVAVIDERQFLFLVHETPMFALHVMSKLAERLRRWDEK